MEIDNITIKIASFKDLKEKDIKRIQELMDVFVSNQNRKITKEDVIRTIDNPAYTLFIAQTNEEEIVGVTGLIEMNLFTGKVGILEELVVHPEFQRQGIAEKLIEHVIEKAKEEKMNHVKLDTAIDNSANNLYQKLGFTKKNDTVYKLYLFNLYK